MQNTISDALLLINETKKSTATASRSRRTEDQVQITDPFLQIIMNLVSQNADADIQGESLGAPQSIDGALSFQLPGIFNIKSVAEAYSAFGGSELTQLTDVLPGLLLSQTGRTDELASLLGVKPAGIEDAVNGQMGTTAYGKLLETVLQNSAETGGAPDAGVILQKLGGEKASNPGETQIRDADASSGAAVQLTQTPGDLPINKGDYESTPPNVRQFAAELQKLNETGNVPIVSAEAETDGDASDAHTPENFFGTVVLKAKDILSKQSKMAEAEVKPETAEVQLQSKALTPFELRFKTADSVNKLPISEQLSTGIKENISLGKNQFIIKLSPENLGEITVKLVEEAGKTTLMITTASAQTAKLINSDMDALKAAVAPMHVHVNEAVPQNEATQQGGMQQFDMAGQFAGQQQFASQQFASGQSFLRMTQAYDEGQDEAYLPEVTAAAAMSLASTGRLDAYI